MNKKLIFIHACDGFIILALDVSNMIMKSRSHLNLNRIQFNQPIINRYFFTDSLINAVSRRVRIIRTVDIPMTRPKYEYFESKIILKDIISFKTKNRHFINKRNIFT